MRVRDDVDHASGRLTLPTPLRLRQPTHVTRLHPERRREPLGVQQLLERLIEPGFQHAENAVRRRLAPPILISNRPSQGSSIVGTLIATRRGDRLDDGGWVPRRAVAGCEGDLSAATVASVCRRP